MKGQFQGNGSNRYPRLQNAVTAVLEDPVFNILMLFLAFQLDSMHMQPEQPQAHQNQNIVMEQNPLWNVVYVNCDETFWGPTRELPFGGNRSSETDANKIEMRQLIDHESAPDETQPESPAIQAHLL